MPPDKAFRTANELADSVSLSSRDGDHTDDTSFKSFTNESYSECGSKSSRRLQNKSLPRDAYMRTLYGGADESGSDSGESWNSGTFYGSVGRAADFSFNDSEERRLRDLRISKAAGESTLELETGGVEADDDECSYQWKQSKGSALHSEGKCKPCLFFPTATGCGNGADCSFCHLQHCRKQMTRPCKAKRDRLKRLMTRASGEVSQEPCGDVADSGAQFSHLAYASHPALAGYVKGSSKQSTSKFSL